MQKRAEACAVLELEVGCAAASERMVAPQVVVHPNTGNLLHKISCSFLCLHEIADHGCYGARMRVWFHDGDLSACPVQHPGAYRMTFRSVGIEQTFRRPAVDSRGELPAKIHRVADAGIQP